MDRTEAHISLALFNASVCTQEHAVSHYMVLRVRSPFSAQIGVTALEAPFCLTSHSFQTMKMTFDKIVLGELLCGSFSWSVLLASCCGLLSDSHCMYVLTFTSGFCSNPASTEQHVPSTTTVGFYCSNT